MNRKKHISISSLRFVLTMVVMVIVMLSASSSFAQGWEKFYGGNEPDEGHAVVQAADGGFAMAGYNDFNTLQVIRTDQNGNVEWETAFSDILFFQSVGHDIIQTADRGFIIAGTSGSGIGGGKDFFLVKIDKDGNEEWLEWYFNNIFADEECFKVQQTVDGGYILAGYASIDTDNTDAFLIKTTSDGTLSWEGFYGGSFNDRANSVIQTQDGGYLVAGQSETIQNSDTDFFLVKTDALGQEVWAETYSQTFDDVANGVVQLDDGSYVAAGKTATSAVILKVDEAGTNPEWSPFVNGIGSSFEDVEKTTDGNLILVGLTEISTSQSKVYLVKSQNDGTEIWSTTFGREVTGPAININGGYDVQNTIDGGYIIAAGSSKIPNFFDTDSYLIKTNSEGNIYTNYIEGLVFDDVNENCIQDDNEPAFNDWIIEAKGTKSFYGTTNANGEYSILVDNGTYDVSLILPSNYAQSCVNLYNTTVSGTNDTTSFIFPVQEITSCPLMQVDVSTALLEKCHYADYTVNYANRGTETAFGAEVKVNLDEYLLFNSADLPSTIEVIDGEDFHVFDVGNVGPYQTGSFKINVFVDCVEPQLQQTHCVTALIFPDTLCEEVDPLWNGASIKVTGVCETDSVRFNITNTGTDNIQGKNFIVIEDVVMLFQVPIDLDAGQTIPISLDANGSTYRVMSQQADGHPGNSMPTFAIEGCDVNNMPFETGNYTMFPEDERNKSISIDCKQNINPANEPRQHKAAYPTGYEELRCITDETQINYHIRFQNTMTDSIHRVIVRDTLSELIDISTVEIGASSHDYTFEIYDERILKFTFDNIMLPDSSTNEAASHGFVKFRVSQEPGNEVGDVITNRSAIYFDFEPWIETQEIFHTICGEWENFITVSTTKVFTPDINIDVFPNPFVETATFQMKGSQFQEVQFMVYDLQGRMVRNEIHYGNEFEFHRNAMSSGMYVYRIESAGQPIAVGKIVIE